MESILDYLLRKRNVTLILLLISMFASSLSSCGQNNPSDSQGKIDKLKITFPTNNSEVSDLVDISVNIPTGQSVAKVVFFVDNDSVHTDVIPPFTYQWNTSSFGDSTQHAMFIQATNTEGIVSGSEVVLVRINKKLGVPDPLNLSVSSVSESSALLTWGRFAGNDFKSYRILMDPSSQGNGSLSTFGSDIVQLDDTTLLITSLEDGWNYRFAVQVFDLFSKSQASNIVSISTPNVKPRKVGLIVTETESAINLEWTPNTNLDFLSYDVYRSIGDDVFDQSEIVLRLGEQSTVNHLDIGASMGSKNYYKVRVMDINGSFSDSELGTYDPAAEPTPISLTVSERENCISLSWERNPNFDFSHYTLYRSLSNTIFDSSEIVYSSGSRSVTSFCDTGASLFDKNFYSIKVSDALLNNSQSNLTLYDATRLPTSHSLAVVIEYPLKLAWARNQEFDFMSYELFRSTGSDLGELLYATTVRTDTILAPSTSGLLPQTTYNYRLRATDKSGRVTTGKVLAKFKEGTGKALKFARGDIVSVPYYPALDFQDEFTLESWIKLDASEISIQNGVGRIIDRPAVGTLLYQYSLTPGKIQICASATGFVNTATGFVFQADVWTHLAVTYKLGTLNTYQNGVLMNSANVEHPRPCVGPSGLFFGKLGNSDFASHYFAGAIDEVRIWNLARTATEIQADFKKVLTGAELGLVGYWRFESVVGQSVPSIVGNAGVFGSNNNIETQDPTVLFPGAL